MSNPFASITDARMASGRLWTPTLSFDLMGRQWGVGEAFWAFDFPATGFPSIPNDSAPYTLETISFHAPENWESDSSYGTFYWYLGVYATWGAGNVNFEFTLDDFSGTADVDYHSEVITPPSETTFLWRRWAGVPSGTISVDLVVRNSGPATAGANITGQRDPRCYLRIDVE